MPSLKKETLLIFIKTLASLNLFSEASKTERDLFFPLECLPNISDCSFPIHLNPSLLVFNLLSPINLKKEGELVSDEQKKRWSFFLQVLQEIIYIEYILLQNKNQNSFNSQPSCLHEKFLSNVTSASSSSMNLRFIDSNGANKYFNEGLSLFQDSFEQSSNNREDSDTLDLSIFEPKSELRKSLISLLNVDDSTASEIISELKKKNWVLIDLLIYFINMKSFISLDFLFKLYTNWCQKLYYPSFGKNAFQQQLKELLRENLGTKIAPNSKHFYWTLNIITENYAENPVTNKRTQGKKIKIVEKLVQLDSLDLELSFKTSFSKDFASPV